MSGFITLRKRLTPGINYILYKSLSHHILRTANKSKMSSFTGKGGKVKGVGSEKEPKAKKSNEVAGRKVRWMKQLSSRDQTGSYTYPGRVVRRTAFVAVS